uniref:Uncharacterized protein n=1 Tax=Acanthochromis polyacanthus TaxID=80966 RepID=A0A3Q1FVK8_9TELE
MPKSKEVPSSTSGSDSDSEVETNANRTEPNAPDKPGSRNVRDFKDGQLKPGEKGIRTGEPGENPHMHRENMQTPCRKIPGWDLNQGSSCCKAKVLTTTPLCSLELLNIN